MAVTGRIDSLTSPVFEAQMLKWVDSEAAWFVLDLSSVSFMSSAALRVLLTMAKRTARSKKTIVLAAPSAEIQDILNIANFTAVFKIELTVDAAIATAMP